MCRTLRTSVPTVAQSSPAESPDAAHLWPTTAPTPVVLRPASITRIAATTAAAAVFPTGRSSVTGGHLVWTPPPAPTEDPHLPAPVALSDGPVPSRPSSSIEHAAVWVGDRPWLTVLALVFLAIWVAGRVALVRWRHRHHADHAQLITIAPPPEVDPAGARALWANLSGTLSPSWRRRLVYGTPHVVWEYQWTGRQLTINLWVPGSVPVAAVEAAIRGAWPGAATSRQPATPPVPRRRTRSPPAGSCCPRTRTGFRSPPITTPIRCARSSPPDMACATTNRRACRSWPYRRSRGVCGAPGTWRPGSATATPRHRALKLSMAMYSGELPFDVDAGLARRQPVSKEILIFQRQCVLCGPQVPAISHGESTINQICRSGRGEWSTECGSGQSRYLS